MCVYQFRFYLLIMFSPTAQIEDYQGRYACIFRQIASTEKGTVHEGVASPIVSPEVNRFWAPKELNLGNKKALVTLENPSASGLCPQVSSIILDPVEDSVIAQMILDRERRLAEIRYGSKKVKAPFDEKYVQLELGLFRMPTDIYEFQNAES